MNRLPEWPMAEVNRQKTICPQGHPYDETNTRHYAGRRYCKACLAERTKRWRAENRDRDRERQRLYDRERRERIREAKREYDRAYRARKRAKRLAEAA